MKMRDLFTGKRFYVFAAALVALLALADVWFLFLSPPAGAPAAAEEPDQYEIRSGLLQEAMDFVGPCSPQGAARLWAEGLKTRSAALQYAAMTKELKEKYAADLEQTFPNWVTGVSSPWIESYALTQSTMDPDNECFHIRFTTATSSGPAGDWDAVLVVSSAGEFWRVSELFTEPELDAYTGFRR